MLEMFLLMYSVLLPCHYQPSTPVTFRCYYYGARGVSTCGNLTNNTEFFSIGKHISVCAQPLQTDFAQILP